MRHLLASGGLACGIAVLAGVPGQAQAAEGTPRAFYVDSIEVSGASVFKPEEIENIVYPFTGENKTAADVEAARKALQDAYAARGYEAAIVDLPPQDEAHFAAGIVQLHVAEVPVAQVHVDGAKFHSEKTLRAQLPALAEGKPLNLKTLQTQLVEAGRVADRQVEPTFKPSRTEGAIDVDLKVKDRLPLHGSLDLGNDNSPNTHPLRLAASLRYTNLWGAGHTIAGSYIVAPEDRKQTEVFTGSYSAPIMGTPWSFLISGYRSNTNIPALGGTQVLGNGYQVGARAIYRIAGLKTDQTISFGADYKNFRQKIDLAGTVTDAPVHYVPLALSYGWSRPGDKDSIDFTLSGTLGLRVLHRQIGGEDQFTNSQSDARENFVHVNLDLTYTRLIADDTTFVLRTTAQYADSHLVSNEQFSIGGTSAVRGYYTSEAVGDRGFAQQFEIDAPSFADEFPHFIGEFRPYVFADWGMVYTVDPLPNQISHSTLVGVGAGLRYRLFKVVAGDVTLGIPLRSATDNRLGDYRITFSARGEF